MRRQFTFFKLLTEGCQVWRDLVPSVNRFLTLEVAVLLFLFCSFVPTILYPSL